MKKLYILLLLLGLGLQAQRVAAEIGLFDVAVARQVELRAQAAQRLPVKTIRAKSIPN